MAVSIENISDKKLKKEYKVTIPYAMIDEKVDSYIDKVRPTYNLKGFRKGQVPANVIKEKYGKSMLAEESDKFINETIKDLVKDNDLKLALSPKVDVEDFEKVANDNSDIKVNVTFELYPEVPEVNLSKLKIVKREAEINQKDVDEALDKLLKFYRKWDKQEDSYKAKKGDSVNIDYVGKIDKEEFEGGSAKGYQLELGSKNFIDNFEDQLVGKKAGDEAKIKVKFPKDYHSNKFAGKAAEFEVKVHEVLTAQAPEINDEFVKSNFGMDNKDKLEEAVKKQVEGNYEGMSKNLFKKELFDFFDKKYDFDLPEGLVEEQLKTIWAEVEEELKTNPDKFKNDKEKKKAKDKNAAQEDKLAATEFHAQALEKDIKEKDNWIDRQKKIENEREREGRKSSRIESKRDI